MTIELHHPFSETQVRALEAGQAVRLTGVVYTGRDRLHKFLHEGGAAPVCLRDGAIYHCGPVVVPDGPDRWRIVAAGPTTSAREDAYMPSILAAHGLRVIIGKGGMGAATRDACREYGCVYLQAVGGAAALLAARIRAVRRVFFLAEFGATEAMWELDVAGLEAIVAIDTHGRSLFEEVAEASHRQLERLLA
jgi:fumarate hydratase class I